MTERKLVKSEPVHPLWWGLAAAIPFYAILIGAIL